MSREFEARFMKPISSMRAAIKSRACPLCSNFSLSESGTDISEYFFYLHIQCTCGGAFTSFGTDEADADSLVLVLDTSKSPGWFVCRVCSLPFTRAESAAVGMQVCPACGCGSITKKQGKKIQDSSHIPCQGCDGLLKSTVLFSSTEYRDGITGDYFRTSEDILAYCISCNDVYYVKTVEDDKFGLRTVMDFQNRLNRVFTERLVRVHGVTL